MVLPNHHREGFGQFLIDISYQISKQDNVVGSPEKPLSELGRTSYLKYWKFKICKFMLKSAESFGKDRSTLIADCSKSTFISIEDVTETLEELNILSYGVPSLAELAYEWFCIIKVVNSYESRQRLTVDLECLSYHPSSF